MAIDVQHTPAHDRFAALLILPLLTFLAMLVAVFFVFYRTAYVDGESMYPALHDTDRLLITRTYTSPRRGDIVDAVVRTAEGPVPVLKRVVGLPGDEIEIQGDRAFVNGEPENYPFPVNLLTTRADQGRLTTTVPAGMVFVLGDNRGVSLDSRFVGPVRLDDINGKAVAIYSPVTRIRRIRYDTSK